MLIMLELSISPGTVSDCLLMGYKKPYAYPPGQAQGFFPSIRNGKGKKRIKKNKNQTDEVRIAFNQGTIR